LQVAEHDDGPHEALRVWLRALQLLHGTRKEPCGGWLFAWHDDGGDKTAAAAVAVAGAMIS